MSNSAGIAGLTMPTIGLRTVVVVVLVVLLIWIVIALVRKALRDRGPVGLVIVVGFPLLTLISFFLFSTILLPIIGWIVGSLHDGTSLGTSFWGFMFAMWVFVVAFLCVPYTTFKAYSYLPRRGYYVFLATVSSVVGGAGLAAFAWVT